MLTKIENVPPTPSNTTETQKGSNLSCLTFTNFSWWFFTRRFFGRRMSKETEKQNGSHRHRGRQKQDELVGSALPLHLSHISVSLISFLVLFLLTCVWLVLFPAAETITKLAYRSKHFRSYAIYNNSLIICPFLWHTVFIMFHIWTASLVKSSVQKTKQKKF